MKFAIGIGRNEPITEVGDHARVAEESGFDYLSAVDMPFLSREVDSMMTLAALHTSRIRIGQGVTDPVTRHPLVVANAAATIDELSGGRAFVGIGTAGPWGKPMTRPARLAELREAVIFIRRYTAGEKVEWHGVEFQSEWCRRQVPIYMACGGARSCRLAGELADGIITPSNADITTNLWRREQIARGAEGAGRDPSEIDYWIRGMIHVAESKEAARYEAAGYAVNAAYLMWSMMRSGGPEIEELRRRLTREYPTIVEDCKRVHDAFDPAWMEHPDAPAARLITREMLDTQQVVGTPEQVREQLARIEEAGFETFGTVTYTIGDKRAMMRRIGEEVIPHFKR